MAVDFTYRKERLESWKDQRWFLDPNRSLNHKNERFKVFEIKSKSNCDDVIINLITILNINKNIKLMKIEKLTKIV